MYIYIYIYMYIYIYNNYSEDNLVMYTKFRQFRVKRVLNTTLL